MSLRPGPVVPPRARNGAHAPPPPMPDIYNIIPIHDLLSDHPSLRYPEVRAAAAALRDVSNLPRPPFVTWDPHMDLMDWVGLLFGFQRDNVRNQREHLVLHLANSQMRLQPPPSIPDALDPKVLRRFRTKLLGNYTSWCSYLGRKSEVVLAKRSNNSNEQRRQLLYVALYLLIWGESANLRFMPECLCYIYHFMAMELNKVLDEWTDPSTGRAFMPSVFGDCAFLKCIVMPFYQTVKDEVDGSNNGTKPHSAWRNYDDLNEFFWSRRCFRKLGWPINFGRNYFSTVEKSKRVGKTGFVEQRSFWNVFRSFDKLWVLLILYLQASVIVAWAGTRYPWQALENRDVQVELLTCFITWAGLRFLQSILDAGTQYSLVSRDTKLLGLRMVLKCLVALTWTVVFGVFYARIWSAKNSAQFWSTEANDRIVTFLEAVFVYVIPELLALVLFALPWIRNALEELDWSILYVLTWWFHKRIFVGRGLREGLINNVKYTLFWVIVLASKFIFSYFLQIRPLVAPTRALLDLGNVPYNWHQFFGGSNRIGVILIWMPVVLIYFMDLQIFYSIFSSFVGAMIGLFSHLGEIRNIDQLRLRFQFFASALQFNLMPEEQLLSPKMTLVKKLRDAIHRLKLRYGLGQLYKKIESSQVEATRFALIWNEIITTFREEDIISDQELELLELPPNCWNIRVIRWPCVLLCNELLLALNQAQELADAPDRWIWLKVSKSEYRRCAVIEAYDSIKHLLLTVVRYGTEEHSIIEKFFDEIDNSIQFEKFTEAYHMKTLERIRSKLISLVEFLMEQNKDLNKAVNILQALYELCVREFPKGKKTVEQLRQKGLAPHNPATNEGLLFENAIEIPDTENEFFNRNLRRLQTILTSRDSMHNVPKNIEARRRIAFFSNSLFMNMPHAPNVEKMMAFSVLTPYYEEECICDEVTGEEEVEYYSVLVKYDQQLQREVEIYRIRLPGPLKLGEGKPENQNHAIIFTRGDAVQTIDMNQDNYFEEALKMRNLLEEFKTYYGIRRPTILGVRENIFTGSVSSLAWFMSAQETSFVTLGQRVLANPLKVRMHYGHPDVFDRFWFFPRGGISKASRVINISEDIFAGFNCTLRGGNVTHHEYIQVGKGRDVGLNQVAMFEAKVASGNGEQVLSRDVYRLGHKLDFFRMLSFYYTTVGYYFNTMVLVLSVYAFLWGRLYLALSGVEGYMSSSSSKAFGTILNQQFIIQLGLFTALPMVVENSLEHGFLPAIWDFLTMQLQLASLFYTFSMGTRNHYFGRTILHGGAKYRATGRGFVVQHKSFAENYRLFARSHFVKAIELGVILTVYAVNSALAASTFVYIIMTISCWFLVVSWIMSPFVFNPSGFDWLKTVYDFEDFMNWIWYRGVLAKADQSWETWWYEEQDHLRTTGLWGKLLEIILDLRFFFFQYGVVYHLHITNGNTSIGVYLLSWIYMVAAVGIYVSIAYARDKFAAKEHIKYRLAQLIVISLTILVIVLLLQLTRLNYVDLISSLLAFIPTGWGLICIAQVLKPFLQSSIVWDTVVSLARLYDMLFGIIVMVPVAFLSWLPGFQLMQTRILFNQAFSRGLQISLIVTGKKSN
ncbi:transferase, transferring glycosyl groups, putative [Ricinus communis]|uniref:1,3-beta-glucan synthase n=1 Tax=Ricinus communis TaxID=3988 RepID=B9RZ95_RICCO|nr:transferase, transferring glycosyl groups, putative [Ricinus communis]